MDDLLKKKITQFNFKLGCSEDNQKAWRLKMERKDSEINSLEASAKYKNERISDLMDNLSEAKKLLANKTVEEPVVKKART